MTLIAGGGVLVVLGQALSMAIELWVLLEDAGWPLRQALDTTYVQTSLVRIAVGAGLLACALGLRRRGPRPGRWVRRY